MPHKCVIHVCCTNTGQIPHTCCYMCLWAQALGCDTEAQQEATGPGVLRTCDLSRGQGTVLFPDSLPGGAEFSPGARRAKPSLATQLLTPIQGSPDSGRTIPTPELSSLLGSKKGHGPSKDTTGRKQGQGPLHLMTWAGRMGTLLSRPTSNGHRTRIFYKTPAAGSMQETAATM